MPFRLASVVVVTFVVIAAGCGGGGKKAATPAAGTTSATTATTETAGGQAFTSSKNCAELTGLAAKFAQTLGATSGNAQATITDQAKAFEAMANAAPSEIRDDFKLVASAFNGYAQAFVKAGIKPGKVPSQAQLAQLGEATKAFSTPKLRAAEQRLSAWGRKYCGASG